MTIDCTTVNIYSSAANIVATSIVPSQSQTPCVIGTCTVAVNVIWQNKGGAPGTFTPSLKIDGNSITSPYSSMLLDQGMSTTPIVFDITALLTNTGHAYNICPDPP